MIAAGRNEGIPQETDQAGTQGRRPELLLRATKTWALPSVFEIAEYRYLLWNLVLRDLRLRYRQTILGLGWVVLQPLLGAAIMAYVFGKVAHLSADGLPYLPFAYVGMLGWNLFSGGVVRGSGSLVSSASLISKVYFPRVLLPLSALIGCLIDFVAGLLLVPPLFWGTGLPMRTSAFALPLALAPLLVFALGIALLAGPVSVRYRDVNHALPVLVQLLFYITPVAYAVSAVPMQGTPILWANPLTHMFAVLRWTLFARAGSSPSGVVYATVVALVSLVLGLLVFRRMERSFADVI